MHARSVEQPDDATMLRFWAKVRPKDGCWVWTGATVGKGGYGRFKVGGRLVLPHKLSFELAFGAVPEGRECCHTCRTTGCVNPYHMYAGTRSENVRDAIRDGSHHFLKPLAFAGENNANSRLTGDDVRNMRRLRADGRSVRSIAREFGISGSSASQVILGKRWRHIQAN